MQASQPFSHTRCTATAIKHSAFKALDARVVTVGLVRTCPGAPGSCHQLGSLALLLGGGRVGRGSYL